MSCEDMPDEISGIPSGEWISEAADAFTRAALDDITWEGDTEGQGLNPLDLGAHSWEPASSRDVAGAYTDPADSPETQVENALSPRAVEIIEALHISATRFGDLLYYDVNGHGTGFWDQDFSDPRWRELSNLAGHHPWGVWYGYDEENDPDGDHVTLSVMNG